MKHLWFFKLWGYIIYGNYPCVVMNEVIISSFGRGGEW